MRHTFRSTSYVTAPRPAIPFATEALTRRTNFRKAALGHWDPRVQQGWLYNLGYAAQQLDFDVHQTNLVVNHHHTSITPHLANIAAIEHQLHQPMSCFVNKLLQKRGFDAMDTVWDGQQPHRLRLGDVEASISNSIYERVQAVAAGLVDRPEDMPGFVFDYAMWRPGCVVEVDAVKNAYFDLRYRPKSVEIDFIPDPRALALFNWDVQKLIYWMRRLERYSIRKILSARKRPCRGAGAVLRIHPFDEPRTRRETRGGTVPTFRFGAQGMVRRETRITASMETTQFRNDYAACSRDFRSGNRERVFPYGTDKMVRAYSARCEAEPRDEALLFRPGKSRQELEAEHHDLAELSERARTVIENVMQAIDAEAPFLEEFAEAVFVGPRAPRTRTAPTESGDPDCVHVTEDPAVDDQPQATDEVAVQTLRGRRAVSTENPPRSVVVLRTRYPTRAPDADKERPSGRRANDEPDD